MHETVSKPNNRAALLVGVVLVAMVSFVAGTRVDQIKATIAPWFGFRASADTLETAGLQDTYRKLKAEYDGELDTQALLHGASRGMVEAVGDPHTVYFDPQEAVEFEKAMRGDIGGGIGAEIGFRSNRPIISRPLKDSPAEKAGLRSGDIIMAVNGQPVAGQTLDQVVQKIRGEIGTQVEVAVLRGESSVAAVITRAQVTAPTVESTIEGTTGIIRLYRFNGDTGPLVRAAAEQFRQAGVAKVILDLRDNPGGTVAAAQEVAGLWLDGRVIMTERRGQKTIKTIKATGKPLLDDMRTIVLINGSSASASEIVAGALKEYGKAQVVGEKSYGKGSVQILVELAGGAQLKVTEARWFTPKGNTIDKAGIQPDIVVVPTPEDTQAGRDSQLNKAKAL